jgi:superfamily II DNA or RNA helicase
MELQPGQRIKAPFLPTNAEIKKIEYRRGYTLLEVVLLDNQKTFKSLRINQEQLSHIQVLSNGVSGHLMSAEDFFFYIEANRIRLAYQFDPHLAISISQVDPLPHQIEAVYHYVLNSPRVRFLIADDPGAGKTIMAGLIIKELEYRRLVQRVLIVAPGHLKYQWQREMKDRFGESFAIVDRGRMDSAWGENVWEERDRLITSLDFIKQDDVRHTLRASHWDLVVVDEAHKMSAYAYQSRNRVKIDKTKRYQVGEVLSNQTEHLLFLTATPHRGDDENFRLFLDLLRPGFFAQTTLLKESVENKENPIFVRRLKEDMRTFEGKAIFPPRHVHTIAFRLSGPEIELYNAVTCYVQDYFDRAKEKRSITFALMILQRRLTSSTHAILKSLQRRKQRLEEILAIPEKLRQSHLEFSRYEDMSEEELEDLPDAEREAIERQLEYLTIADNLEDVQAEIAQLQRLIEQAWEVRKQEVESKLAGLRDQVLPLLGDRKLLIFTEFRDTLEYLTEKLRAWGYTVINIHGQMNMDARIQAEHEFWGDTQIMVATEAAGEGINLQVCSLMVNYDIPWTPTRLEQRLGRIHRYGQVYEVHIWNMISRDTREGQILDKLFEKLNAMRAALNSDRVFDIIGEMIPATRLDELLKDAIFNQRRIDEIEQVIDRIDPIQLHQTIERVFQTSLATRHIDYSGLRQESLLAEENRLVPEYVSDYFLRAFSHLGGTAEIRRNPPDSQNSGKYGKVYSITSVPFDLRRWGEGYDFKTRYGKLFRQYRRITFDKSIARQYPDVEFVAPGHPLLEAVNEQILTSSPIIFDNPTQQGGRYPFSGAGLERVAVFGDPEEQRRGALWFLEGEVTDGTGSPAGKRVFCVFQDMDGQMRSVNPAVLWDLESTPTLTYEDVRDESPPTPPYQGGEYENIPNKGKEETSAVNHALFDLLDQRNDVEDYIITHALLPFRDEIAARREQEIRIKEKYGLRSLDFLIQEANGKILDYQMRQAAGEDMDLALFNEQRNLESLNTRRSDLEREIRLEGSLTVTAPRLLGTALVVPLTELNEQKETPDDSTTQGAREKAEQPYRTDTEQAEVDTGIDADKRAEIESIGMQVALEYECQQGWSPQDVSSENLGFDIRSTCYADDGSFLDIRYIEVKARAQSGAVRISANEWKKARHFGDKFWLYIVTQAGSDEPQLHCIQNPAERFEMEVDIFTSGYQIPEERWLTHV